MTIPEPWATSWEANASRIACDVELTALAKIQAVRDNLTYLLTGQLNAGPDLLLALVGLLAGAAGELSRAQHYRSEAA